jgi:hypothetical protein
MCLRPGEDIGDEVHPHVDQFFRIEKGQAKFVLNEKEEHTVSKVFLSVAASNLWSSSTLPFIVANILKTSSLSLRTD